MVNYIWCFLAVTFLSFNSDNLQLRWCLKVKAAKLSLFFPVTPVTVISFGCEITAVREPYTGLLYASLSYMVSVAVRSTWQQTQHPSIHHFSLWGRRLSSHTFHFLLGDPEVFPGQTRHIISPAHSDSTLGFSSQLCIPRKPPKGGIPPLTRCINHLNWLLNIKEQGPYSEFLTVPLRLNGAGVVSHPQPRLSVPPFPIREPRLQTRRG